MVDMQQISLSSGHYSRGPASDVFGTTSAYQTVTLQNSGTAPLAISTVTLTGGDAFAYVLGDSSCAGTLAPGGSCQVQVAFNPGALGSWTASLTFRDNAADSPQSVALSGVGVAPAVPQVTLAPDFIDFGDQPVGTTSAFQTITAQNTGTAPLTISGLTLTGADAPSYVLGDGNCMGMTLAPGTSCQVQIAFQPVAFGSGSQGGFLAFDIPGSPEVDVELAGLGTVSAG